MTDGSAWDNNGGGADRGTDPRRPMGPEKLRECAAHCVL
jgi:hypothetical protein